MYEDITTKDPWTESDMLNALELICKCRHRRKCKWPGDDWSYFEFDRSGVFTLIAVLMILRIHGHASQQANTVIPSLTQKQFLGISNKTASVRHTPCASPNPNQLFRHFHFVRERVFRQPLNSTTSPAWPKKKTTPPSPSRNEQLTRHISSLNNSLLRRV